MLLCLELIVGDDLMNTRKKNNNTRAPNRNLRKEEQSEESALGSEVAKYLIQCGGESRNNSDTKSHDGGYLEENPWNMNDRHSNSYGNQQSYNSYGDSNRHGTTQYPQYSNTQDPTYHNKRTANPRRNYGNDNSHDNEYSPRTPYTPNNSRNYGYTPDNDQKQSQCGVDKNGNYGYNNRDSNSNRNDQNPYRFFNVFRSKRFNNSNSDDEDDECVSQCVFEYLQLLDDDRIPSESLFIKWLQENASGTDMDRIKSLRETRLCFGRVAATDTDDGCKFSKELAKCLNLNID
ncbi:hypothetical protein GWI33_005034 [Rhynchophorus ferrugineus]|uniref:Uncharacterized protein n=1 Tax=Rhynchophorus ferrugineus TaxID=354439 RepID=A0A834ME56_RHYFE|nr:hypothetical protein GWI33_005034 [Rhynchophorus ferrugineus]